MFAHIADTKQQTHVPFARFRARRDGDWHEFTTDDLFAGKKVVVFGLPGAFTPTCSSSHLPRYNELAPAFRAAGVDEIAVVSVNDGTYETRRNVGVSLLGAYGEVGYTVGLFSGMYAGIALKAHLAQARRDGTTTDLIYTPETGDKKAATTKHEKTFKQIDVKSTKVGDRNVPSIEQPFSQIYADARACFTIGWAF